MEELEKKYRKKSQYYESVTSRDGDGWVQCTCGSKHWGLHGAAGLLVVRGRTVLLQHRAPWVHNGDTWGIPGGAIDSHESIEEAAAREAHEEVGIPVDSFEAVTTHLVDHTLWRYTTVIARAKENIRHDKHNEETLDMEWVDIESVDEKNLHPSFEKAWPELKLLVKDLIL